MRDMHNSTLIYLENDRGEYLMLHRRGKERGGLSGPPEQIADSVQHRLVQDVKNKAVPPRPGEGLLMLLGASMVLWHLLGKYLQKLPGAALGWGSLALFFLSRAWTAPAMVTVRWLYPLGFTAPGFYSADYFPLMKEQQMNRSRMFRGVENS